MKLQRTTSASACIESVAAPQRRSRRGALRVRLVGAIFVGLLLSLTGAARTAQALYVITQKGRAFHPLTITINRGDTLQFFDDDGDLLHHAYVNSDTFNFDSGDQLPGSRTNIIFSVPGTFNVLCGIHPKMKLVVTVK
jgi:plastocyanin